VLTCLYNEKKLRGRKLVKVRRILEQRARTGGLMRDKPLARRGSKRPLSTIALMRIYRQEADRQKVLIKKAELLKVDCSLSSSPFALCVATIIS
jgi:ParB family chromosome partitioning protein